MRALAGLLSLSLALAAAARAAEPPAETSRAAPTGRSPSELMKRGLYHDAARALLGEIKGQPEARCGRQFLMLGECLYQGKEYAKARPYFAKALTYGDDARSKTIAEYRLACVAYRMGDAVGAQERIDRFVRDHPSDRRCGTLLLFGMKLLARQGAQAEGSLEAVHKAIRDRRRGFGPAAAMAADKLLTDFYLKHGREEKARERYASIVHSFRNVIAQYARDKRPVPETLRQAHDDAAMQLGIISLRTQRYDEAVKWLENVRYDPALQRKARLVLAQVAYQRRDVDRAIRHLTRDGFLDTVPPGPLRSDMCLVLGLCQKSKGRLNEAVNCLTKVARGSGGYAQAQVTLGDLCRERGFLDRAIEAYANAVASPKYEAHVLFHLASSYTAKAEQAADGATRDALYRKAAERFSQLTTKYPGSRLTKQASASIDALLGKGYQVSVAMDDAEQVRRWEQAARERPGSPEAARALANIARLHHKSVMDEKRQRFLKAPNYAACAAACERLLDGRVYAGSGLTPEQWKDLRVDAFYYRAVSHVASIAPDPEFGKGGVVPTYVKAPDVQRAIRDLHNAKAAVDPRRLDMVKSIELALLEAMLKSHKEQDRERARARFAELTSEYGTDARFQKLAMELADWYRREGRYAEAAREYRGIAERGASLDPETRLKALFLAGTLFSKAGYEAPAWPPRGQAVRPGERRYGIVICPRNVFQRVDLLKTWRPLQRPIRVSWPPKAKWLSGEQALRIVSEASGVPFVWSPERRPGSVAAYLAQKRVRFESLRGTAADFLRQILDVAHHRLAFDVGLTGGAPTLEPKADDDDPERAGEVRTLEIYDQRQWATRYRPLTRDYGSWRQVHNGRAMMFHVIARIEERTGTKVLWADGVPKTDVLAAEHEAVPGVESHRGLSCGGTLARLLEPLDLRFTIEPRDRSAELYDEAMGCFNEIRKVEPRSRYGERSLFLLAINFYHQEDYGRMKIVLKEYLKLFDAPGHEHYHDACFWVGWVFEHERRYRDACRYYNRAAEETLVVYRPAADEQVPSRDELKGRLSYETRFSLEEPVSGRFEAAKLEAVADFVRLHCNVPVRLDASAVGIEPTVSREPFAGVPAFGVLCDALDHLGLSFRVANANPAVAEKAYYRLASAHKKDGLMEQALASCNVLLDRFPDTARKRDAYKLKLDVYKGLKDYRNVLATLDQLKAELGDAIEAYQIDFEMAWIYFDLCRYGKAVEHFRKALAAARDAHERVKIRDGYARALFRSGDCAEALHQFQTLAREEPEPLRAFIDRQMAWCLGIVGGTSASDALPADAAKLIAAYEELPEARRHRLANELLAKVTWIYYTAALVDLKQGHPEAALEKLGAAANSPDDWLAADALYRTGLLHLRATRLNEAREAFEYLLFSTRSAEAEVRAAYALGLCHEALGDPERARTRFDQVLQRFPDSAYADKVRAKREQRTETER